MFFYPKQKPIQVYYRTCFYSAASQHKERPAGFSHEKCFDNFLATLDPQTVDLTILLDTSRKRKAPHYVYKQKDHPVIEISGGSEAAAFLQMLKMAKEARYRDDKILYFVEDDYLHAKGWSDYLIEGLSIEEADYVTLYDHADKYDRSTYPHLSAHLFVSPSSHWRTTPSTTNTYAMRAGTLYRDYAIHEEYSLGREISEDAKKFERLSSEGQSLLSPIPGRSTHCEPAFASPCTQL